ncbi:thermostable hemolysin [Hydrocarboniphaga effusa]|uniref:thermostable hemolysin n=1 Tax=Hydrocarboniphaga effusa TaxID=243629 RepID=UPI0035B0A932
MTPAPLHRATASPKPALIEAQAATRDALTAFIAERFAEVYGARLYCYLPRLFGLHGADAKLLAAVGLRSAASGPLFLERYLDDPIEAWVAKRQARPVSRQQIVEVGNLAGATPGALRELIPMLCERLQAEGFQWVAFTGAARLCNGFSRLGLPLEIIAPAPIERLAEHERAAWGRYYDSAPSVMLGDIGNGSRLLRHQQCEGGDPLAALARVGAP